MGETKPVRKDRGKGEKRLKRRAYLSTRVPL